MSDSGPKPDENPGQFARLLRSVESAHIDAQLQERTLSSDKMRPATHPPDTILRAYCDLLFHVLVYQRALSVIRDANMEEARDLADAMHNIGNLLADYGVHMDDEKFRALYLRRFDRRWAHDGFGLEQFLESRLKRYSKESL
jgi:hypothetical protein